MLIAMEDSDFSEMIIGEPPRGFRMTNSPVAPVNVLEMLRALANSITADFAPAARMIVEDDQIVGILSIVPPPADWRIEIGYRCSGLHLNTG